MRWAQEKLPMNSLEHIYLNIRGIQLRLKHVVTFLTHASFKNFLGQMFLWACPVFIFHFMFHQWVADYIYILSASLISVLIRAVPTSLHSVSFVKFS